MSQQTNHVHQGIDLQHGPVIKSVLINNETLLALPVLLPILQAVLYNYELAQFKEGSNGVCMSIDAS